MLISSENASSLIEQICSIAHKAGAKILEIYEQDNFDIKIKEDESPVTKADLSAHEIIKSELIIIDNSIPILSEESKQIDYNIRKNWQQYWLVDPLDGTKEFIAKTDEFTVNIALIENNKPVLGVIYAPVLDIFYFASVFTPAYKKTNNNLEKIFCRKIDKENVIFTVSRRHAKHTEDSKVIDLLKKLDIDHKNISIIKKGSSLKMCCVAEGSVDIYPRFGPTSEWDTAAAQIILERADGGLLKFDDGKPLKYNKKNLINPDFLAIKN